MRCITLTIRGRRQESNINDSIFQRDRGWVVLVVGVREEANISRAGSRRGSDEVFWFSGDRMVGSNKANL
jgi:hypothetical protein